MANLSEILDSAHEGEAIAMLGRELGLTPAQTKSAVEALLPAISTGLKQSTSTVDGLSRFFSVIGQQKTLYALYDDPETVLEPQGLSAGNDVLSVIFGSPDVSRAVVDQAQRFSGVDSGILKKLLPVLTGIVISGMMRGGASAKPAAPAPSPSSGDVGGIGDILGQIFGRGMPGGATAPRVPSSPVPAPADQTASGGDLLGTLMRELLKGIQNGTIKPVVIGGGPVQMPMPGGQAPSGPEAPQMPGGDVFGKILRDVLGGVLGGGGAQMPQGGGQPSAPPMKDLSDLTKQLGVMGGGVGTAVFGERFEHGLDVEPSHLDNIQSLLDRSHDSERR
jgi:hypothetical protein